MKLFTAGTARGGTNFRTLILNNHSSVKMAIDPLIPLYRSLRDKIHLDSGLDVSSLPPFLDDYYYSVDKIKSFYLIHKFKGDVIFNPNDWDSVSESLKKRMSLASMNTVDHVEEIRSDTYKGCFENFLGILKNLASLEKKNASILGYNDNWTSEFFPFLMSLFPDAKFMSHVRDPRGVAYSSEYAEPDVAKHPTILSLSRHVRKHLAISFNYKRDLSYHNNVLVTYYEKSVMETEDEAKKYCKFLGIEFEPEMTDIKLFKKANGEKWPSSKKIYRETVNDWQTECPEELIETVEFLCHPEMELHGYRPIIYNSKVGLRGLAFDFIKKNSLQCIGWNTDFKEIEKTLGSEFYRNSLILNKTKLEPEEINRCFLFDSVYEQIMKRN